MLVQPGPSPSDFATHNCKIQLRRTSHGHIGIYNEIQKSNEEIPFITELNCSHQKLISNIRLKYYIQMKILVSIRHAIRTLIHRTKHCWSRKKTEKTTLFSVSPKKQQITKSNIFYVFNFTIHFSIRQTKHNSFLFLLFSFTWKSVNEKKKEFLLRLWYWIQRLLWDEK